MNAFEKAQKEWLDALLRTPLEQFVREAMRRSPYEHRVSLGNGIATVRVTWEDTRG